MHSMTEERKEDGQLLQESRGVSVDSDRPAKKCKGGRKLIYATLEQRKQRNRDAQAAFRERRTEHIAELEKTVEEQKVKLQASQAAHTSSKDECLLLRYKNSLLERILLEKGIDINAELNQKFDLRSEISSRPIREKRHALRDAVAAPLSSRKPHSHHIESTSGLPPSPPNTSPCCSHCTSHADPSPQSHISPQPHEPSPRFETNVAGTDNQLPNANYDYSNKRRRYDLPTPSSCHKRRATGMMQKYNTYQPLHYPQTSFTLAPDTQASRMHSQTHNAFRGHMANDPLAGLFHPPDSVKHLDSQCSTHATETIDCHDSDEIASSEAQSTYSSPNYPPTQLQAPYLDSKALDFDQGPITQLMGSYDANFEMDLEFLSSIQA